MFSSAFVAYCSYVNAVDPSTGVLSNAQKSLIHLFYGDQMSDGEELSLRILLGLCNYSVDVCAHNGSSSESRYVSFQQIRTLASPFPPVGPVAASSRKPCGSPPSSVVWGCKTAPTSLRASSGRPLVARASRPTPEAF